MNSVKDAEITGKDSPLMAVVRIKGGIGTDRKIRKTLELLNLHKPHHATVIPCTPNYEGMLKKARVLITWGNIHFDTFLQLLKQRGELKGGKKLNKETITEISDGKFQNLKDLGEAIWEKRSLNTLKKLKPVFRLHPPTGGYESTKKSFREGGSYGWRGEKINELLKRMI